MVDVTPLVVANAIFVGWRSGRRLKVTFTDGNAVEYCALSDIPAATHIFVG
jgi:hypothetical protein